MPAPTSCPLSTRSTSSSTTARASATFASSPSSVSRLPRRLTAQPSRSRSAVRTPSPMPASSAATSFGTSRTSCTSLSVGAGSGRGGSRALRPTGAESQRELLADDLAHRGAVGAPGDLRHDVRHHAAEVGHARRTHLCDRVVHDLLDLVLGERLRHELLEDLALSLLRLRLLLAAAGPERLGRLEPALPLAPEHLELLVLGQGALELLLGRLEGVEDQAQRVAALGVARLHGLLQLVRDRLDPAHAILPVKPPLSTCQCRWKIVWPAPGPAFTTTR